MSRTQNVAKRYYKMIASFLRNIAKEDELLEIGRKAIERAQVKQGNPRLSKTEIKIALEAIANHFEQQALII